MSNRIANRWSFIKGIGIGAAVPMVGVSAGSGRRTRIVAGRAGHDHEAIYTKKVPKRWLKHQKSIRNITDNLSKEFLDLDHVGSVSYVVTDRTQDGVRFSQPEIAVKPGTSQAKKDSLPDSVDKSPVSTNSDLAFTDIKIREMNGELITQNVDCYRGVTDSTYQGGLEAQDSDSNSLGTSGFKVWDGDDNEYMYTANHILNDGSCDVAGAGMHDANGDPLGKTVDGHKTHDWVTISDESTSYDNTIEYEEGVVKIDGYATQAGMESISGQKGTLKFQGIISGYQDAHVKGGGASQIAGCIKFYGSAAKIGMPDYAREGDSGGPYWWPTDEGDLVVGVHSAGEKEDPYQGCNVSGYTARPCYTYPFWRVANNTNYTVKDV